MWFPGRSSTKLVGFFFVGGAPNGGIILCLKIGLRSINAGGHTGPLLTSPRKWLVSNLKSVI